MGHRQRPKNKSKSARRFYRRTIMDLKNRTRDLDRIQDDLAALAAGAPKESLDYVSGALAQELVAGGAHHCAHCARHFVDARALGLHLKTKDHKHQVKRTKEEKYTQAEADAGAGASAAAR